ncbi:methylmalonyl-CoA mutase family protein [Sulfuritalea sp.]|uniref:methylmalonyl-CoA mutase family protein n=1 Tax=Sulfuritalea sp. TaxID=2480090 RepID=UPI001ACBC065|nr:methylmalonyl-CoA mutase family protein [Sulfuritalea sp.]MBN8476607.1 acyl-CoA mutase large subunit family protein [Sulfuritalea sp.]
MKRETDYGYQIKSVYSPEDIEGFDYDKDLGNPGSFPYTRGYHAEGYRTRMWTQRMTAGLGSSVQANGVLKKYREMGQRGGMCVISDRVFSDCIDPDHPNARREAGVLGWPGCSLLEFEELMDGIPLTGQSITLLGSSAPTVLRLAYVVALARKRGIDPSEVHGSVMESPFENYFGQTDVQPFDLNLKLWLDASEYVVRNKIRMRSSVISQHFQESGGNNAQAIAVVLSMYKELCGKLVNERGLDFDDAAMVPYELVSIGSRFFEEIAKVRAMRRMWARMAKDHFKAKKEKSCQMLIAVHTSGRTMTYQQPLNNIARCAIQTLAGAIVGCTALDNATMDNAYAEPSALAARMSLNTQHIVAVETGVTDVVDPLAGSYFVEALTNQVEAEAYRILKEIDDLGGMIAAVEKGYIQTMLREEAAKKFREVDTRERLVVGVNHLVIAPEEDFEIPIQEVHEGDSEAIATRMETWKKTRDMPLVTARLRQLHADAGKGDRFNLMPAIVEAVEAYATAGEVIGVIRMARGLSYDPFKVIDCPYDFQLEAA